MGEFLKRMPKATGARGQLSGDVPAGARVGGNRPEPPTDKPATLAEIGITKKQSATAQKLAAIPEPEFKERVAVATERHIRTGCARVHAGDFEKLKSGPEMAQTKK
jgi:hypothetical protein